MRSLGIMEERLSLTENRVSSMIALQRGLDVTTPGAASSAYQQQAQLSSSSSTGSAAPTRVPTSFEQAQSLSGGAGTKELTAAVQQRIESAVERASRLQKSVANISYDEHPQQQHDGNHTFDQDREEEDGEDALDLYEQQQGGQDEEEDEEVQEAGAYDDSDEDSHNQY